MKFFFKIVIFVHLVGCSMNIPVMGDGLSGSYILISDNLQISYSKYESENKSVVTDWEKFLEYKNVKVVHGDLTVNIFFDSNLRACPEVMTVTDESMQKFYPAPVGYIGSISHETNLIIISEKSFEFKFPLSNKRSYFAVGVEGCNTLSNKVFTSASLLYHELYHVKSYYSGDYLKMDELEEERRAEIVGICSLVFSDRLTFLNINTLAKTEVLENSSTGRSERHYSNNFKKSLQGQADTLSEMQNYRKNGKSFIEYCKEKI